jgi:hypothetical protein
MEGESGLKIIRTVGQRSLLNYLFTKVASNKKVASDKWQVANDKEVASGE